MPNQNITSQGNTSKRKYKNLLSSACYFLAVVFILVLFFTNDFGLVDIHKTAIVSSVGIDVEEENLRVTAQIAVPLPSENGENVTYTQAEGTGKTVAECLNVINAQTGFYPKLLFCRLVVLGESCKQRNIFSLLDYFYRGDSTQQTMLVAMCKGQAGELLKKPAPLAGATGLTVQRTLSEELKKSANVSTVNLKLLAQNNASHSHACYMPFIEYAQQEGSQQGPTAQGSGGGEESTGFICRKSVLFQRGIFGGLLTENQAFALNLFKNDVHSSVVSVLQEGTPVALGLKAHKSSVKVRVENGVPVLVLTFSAKAFVQDVDQPSSPKNQALSEAPSPRVLRQAEEEIKGYIQELWQTARASSCDVFLAEELLYKYYPQRYQTLSQGFTQRLRLACQVTLAPLG